MDNWIEPNQIETKKIRTNPSYKSNSINRFGFKKKNPIFAQPYLQTSPSLLRESSLPTICEVGGGLWTSEASYEGLWFTQVIIGIQL